MKAQRSIGLVTLLAFAGCITGCQTMNEHRTATGAVVGTAVGAGAGALVDKKHRGEGALIGGAIGAVVGTGVGYMLQKQKDAFDKIQDIQTRQNSVPVAYAPAPAPPPPAAGAPPPPPPPPVASPQKADALTITMSSELLFTVGSSALTDRGAQKIGEVSQILNQYPDSRVIVKGYTSSEGGDQMNMELSQRRADVVKNQLIANRVNPSRIVALGMGSSNPVGDNNTESGRVQNRRVEIDVIPTDQTK